MAYGTYNSYYNAYLNDYQVNNRQIQNNAQSGVNWVQGEAGAKAYLIAPNTTVALWDSEAQTIYLKSADASGMPSIKTLDYTIREASTPTVLQADKYITREEFEKRLSELENK